MTHSEHVYKQQAMQIIIHVTRPWNRCVSDLGPHLKVPQIWWERVGFVCPHSPDTSHLCHIGAKESDINHFSLEMNEHSLASHADIASLHNNNSDFALALQFCTNRPCTCYILHLSLCSKIPFCKNAWKNMQKRVTLCCLYCPLSRHCVVSCVFGVQFKGFIHCNFYLCTSLVLFSVLLLFTFYSL